MTQKEFNKFWIEALEKGKLKRFPEEFLSGGAARGVTLPGKQLVIGPELFGTFEVLDTDGNIVYHAKSKTAAKYLLYANRLRPREIVIPEDDAVMSNSVKEYEKHLDSLLKEIKDDFENKFPGSKHFPESSSHIFATLNIQRIS